MSTNDYPHKIDLASGIVNAVATGLQPDEFAKELRKLNLSKDDYIKILTEILYEQD